ncbi:MAG: amidohydrolase family protein [Saprospiraceae bacterium]|nr:amidohydrolase family protein [Saprospiraceae bacterium]
MPLYHSKLIYTASSADPLYDHVISTEEDGTILDIRPYADIEREAAVQMLPGIIVPGFINAHCHLELSHMRGMIPTGTGLVEFIRQVVTRRGAEAAHIAAHIAEADNEMYRQGIVAVGDISNVSDSFEQKGRSDLRYNTFVEAFDLMQPDNATAEFEKSNQIIEALHCKKGDYKSIVPHATYSVSDPLFRLIRAHQAPGGTASIHHQETEAENQFIASKSGSLVSFFLSFGLNLDQYHAHGLLASSVPIKAMSETQRTLLVHNTMSTAEDIQAIEDWNKNVYWVTCPNANLYIENRMPKYQYWLDTPTKMCIGTDSLASNWQLSILEEIKTIQKYQSYVPFNELIKWGTINGAEALGMEDRLGSIEIGKKPGLVHVYPFDEHKSMFLPDSRATRLI